MSDRQNLAEHGVGLCVVALGAVGLGTGLAAAAPLGVLVAWGIDRYKSCTARRKREIVAKTAKALRESGASDRGVTVALELLKERKDHIRITPADLKDREARLSFPDALYDIVFSGAGVPEDDGVEQILRRTLATAYEALRLEPDFDTVFVQESVTAIERDLNEGFRRIERISEDTNARVRSLEDRIDRLLTEVRDTARQMHVNEGLLIALARRYGETANDFESALAGLQLALETAAEQATRDAQPSNLGEAVDDIVARVAELNAAERIEDADDLLVEEMDRLDAEIEERRAIQIRVVEKAIAQAVYTADADAFADRTLRRIRLDDPSPQDQFDRLRSEFAERWKHGLRFGTPFALEAAAGLARRARSIAPSPYYAAMASNDLAIALANQGTRTEGAAGADLLAQAVAAYRAALEVRTRADHPVDWAMTQENVAIALFSRAERDDAEDPVGDLRAALEAVTGALEVYHPEHMSYDHGTATRLRDRIQAALDAL